VVFFRGAILIAIILGSSGCILLESNPWPRLGADETAAFYLDRHSIERSATSCYRYRVKVEPARDSSEETDRSSQTFPAISLEMHCDDQEMTVRSHDVIDLTGKLLFRRPVLNPTFRNIPPDSIHQVMYNYLCSGRDI